MVQKLRPFYCRGAFCLFVELHRWWVCDQWGYPCLVLVWLSYGSSNCGDTCRVWWSASIIETPCPRTGRSTLSLQVILLNIYKWTRLSEMSRDVSESVNFELLISWCRLERWKKGTIIWPSLLVLASLVVYQYHFCQCITLVFKLVFTLYILFNGPLCFIRALLLLDM